MNLPGALLFFTLVAALLIFFVWAIRWSSKGKRDYQAALKTKSVSRLDEFFFGERKKNWYVSWQGVVGFALSALVFLVVCAALGVI